MAIDIKTARPEELRAFAAESGCELMTTRGAACLFGKAIPTVEQARRLGKIEARFEWRNAKNMPLMLLSSCSAFWGEPDPARLEAFRRNGMLTWISNDARTGTGWNILHSEEEPLLALRPTLADD